MARAQAMIANYFGIDQLFSASSGLTGLNAGSGRGSEQGATPIMARYTTTPPRRVTHSSLISAKSPVTT
jgi:hypothetical protein